MNRSLVKKGVARLPSRGLGLLRNRFNINHQIFRKAGQENSLSVKAKQKYIYFIVNSSNDFWFELEKWDKANIWSNTYRAMSVCVSVCSLQKSKLLDGSGQNLAQRWSSRGEGSLYFFDPVTPPPTVGEFGEKVKNFKILTNFALKWLKMTYLLLKYTVLMRKVE